MNAHEDGETRYQSYMLRMWRTRDSAGQPVWCASLEAPGSHETASFADVQALFAFLLRRMGLAPGGAPAPRGSAGGGSGADQR